MRMQPGCKVLMKVDFATGLHIFCFTFAVRNKIKENEISII